eukprot:TRINITY_DN8981_c0_g1_i1.p1 TRINITY_DN8981_c0_g1~~TRINITY_DN8981_c0_g1_i1.p1  ORF type:complete len:323 (+),score=46.80 TRINITY_DN8981_c0_g1_i1:71-970(+)
MDEALRLIYLCAGPISLLGSATIIFSYGWLKRSRVSEGLHLVFFQALCDFFFTAKFVITALINDPSMYAKTGTIKIDCLLLGMMGQYFGQATMGWNFMISVRIFLSFWDPVKFEHMRRVWFHCYVWIVSAIGTLAALFVKGTYGPSDDGCWYDNNAFILAFFLVPLTVYFLGSLFILIYLLTKIGRMASDDSIGYTRLASHEKKLRNQIVAYIIIFLIFWTPPWLLRILDMLGMHFASTIYMDAICLVTQGLANSIVWMINFKVNALAQSPDIVDDPEPLIRRFSNIAGLRYGDKKYEI